jgi:hypothetical protein
MPLPPKYIPKPPAADPELAAAIAIFATEKRLNHALLERKMGVSLVRAQRLIDQMAALLQERV